jgi:tetratricopeptide (TPR) repeat protein
VLTAYALNARSEAERQRVEAERQRSEAEGLVEYMLTELRIKLKGVGRIDVMADVNSRALKYYDGEFDNLDLASRAQRARVLQQLGENDEDRGDYKSALKKFTEARQTTAALLRAAPRDPERIFDHAQSEYWMGSIEYFGNNRLDAAMRWFREYKRLVDMTVAIEPGNPKYLREAGYADGNLCAIDEKQALTPKATVELCKTALAKMEKAAKYLKPDSGITDDIVNRLGWLADAYVDSGDLAQARAVRLRQESILDPQIAADPWNMAHKSDWIALQIALATLDEKADRMKDAKGRLERARAILEFMIEFDPQNQPWKSQMDWIRNELKKFN